MARGFDHYTKHFVSGETQRPVPENPATTLTDQALAWLDARTPEERIFLWLAPGETIR